MGLLEFYQNTVHIGIVLFITFQESDKAAEKSKEKWDLMRPCFET